MRREWTLWMDHRQRRQQLDKRNRNGKRGNQLVTERSKPSKIVETWQLDLTIALPQSGSFRCYVAAGTGDISPDEECDRN